MANYSHIIDEVCHGAKAPSIARIIIPVLIQWAKSGETHHTYGDIFPYLGYTRYSNIGNDLGNICDIFQELSKLTGEDIPTLNTLVKGKNGLPSAGFDYVYPKYSELSIEPQRSTVRLLESKALSYDKWDWVLAQLGLKPATSIEDEQAIRSGKVHGYGGEGEAHKSLKEYVATHPELVGAKGVGVNESILLSGDRLDVWFPESQIAVEVKPQSSPDADILRGLFQCVKYKAVLDAENAVHGLMPCAKAVLVIEGRLSASNQEVQRTLGIEVLEDVHPNESI